jgi:fluoroquinolone resistance protein
VNSFEEIEFSSKNALEMPDYKASEFLECSFRGMNLSGFEFAQTRFIDCTFESCNLSNCILKGPSFRNVSFSKCKLVGVNFSTMSSQMSLSFEDCLMDYTVFQNLKIEGTAFHKCSLKMADFSMASLKNANFSGSNLEGAALSNCNLEKSDFRGAVNYHIDVNHCFVKGAKFSVPEVLALLSSFEVVIE